MTITCHSERSEDQAKPCLIFAALRMTGWVSSFRILAKVPAALLLLLIRLYQRTLSPALPILTLGRCGCRFAPTCSHYAADAIRTHGVLPGLRLAIVRLVKCTPLHPGGFDPVPGRDDRTTGQPDDRTRTKPACSSSSLSRNVSARSPSSRSPVVQ